MTPTRQLGVFLDDCGSLLRLQTDPGLLAHVGKAVSAMSDEVG